MIADIVPSVVSPPHNTLWLAVCPMNTSMGFVVAWCVATIGERAKLVVLEIGSERIRTGEQISDG